ncbi:MAG TPA: ABC transporter transmembrane domain-containing protein [Luteolibacter sp.]|nr:ABC transporter transmembrane domain-containing protein [Luteolibacter sp.]
MSAGRSSKIRSAYRWIGGYLMQEKTIFLPSVAALLFTACLSLAFPYFLGQLVGSPADAFKHQIPAEQVVANSNRIVLQLLGALALQAFVAFFRVQGFIISGESALNRLRRDLFAHLVRLPMSYFHEQRSGALSNRISSDLGVVRETLLTTVPQAVRHTVILFGGLMAIFYFSWKLSLIMLGSVPIVVLAIAVFGRKVRGYSKAAQESLADSGTVIEETVQGIADVKSFTNEPFEQKRYEGALTRFLDVTRGGARNRAAFLAFVIFALFGTISFVAWYGARMYAHGQINWEQFASFVMFSIFVGASLSTLPEIISQLQQTTGATERLRELLDLQPERDGQGETARLGGVLAFDQVAFRYPSRLESLVLDDVNFQIAAGQRVALVGPSGAGKSTTFSLILGFNEPEKGSVRFDGRDARELSLHSIRSQLAIVPQEVLLFGGSIRENIEYGKPGASLEEIQRAAKQANAHDFIAELPQGYETLVGPRGTKLSGGQRQRIAIARAILADPKILLLDEATSALDSESERLVNDALEHLMEGRTSLVIAHRLSTVRHADRILVFNHGRIVETGTHDELIAKGGTYRYLVETQLV